LRGFARRWFTAESAQPVNPCVADRERIYCIGDIHGRLDLLLELHELILRDSCHYTGDKTLVYLGDYIDRGDDSRGVVDLLIESPLQDFNPVYLRGNHEQSLLDFLEYPEAVAAWLNFGGRAALHSYGIALPMHVPSAALVDIRDELQRRLPKSHLKFYGDLQLIHVQGSYCFVHAGIRPGVPLPEQRNEDLLWIRDDFTQSKTIHEHIVVHGHTISNEVEIHTNRIGIDTGAYASGVLTCLVLEGSEQRIIQTRTGTSPARN